MVTYKTCDPSGLIEATLGGVVTARDQMDLVSFVRAAIAALGTVRVLLKLEQFAAWRHDAAADDRALWLSDDEGMTRMAIVGEPAWRVAVMTVVGQPLRQIPIEYFSDEVVARRWLTAPA